MKQHVVAKLRHELPQGLEIPDWQTFISDKSAAREQIAPELDRLMREASLPFWTTREYRPAGESWSPDERRRGSTAHTG
jgi:hypothetical protein